jgi:HPt (histidine-containing phosphotransfer) domain-containing protein
MAGTGLYDTHLIVHPDPDLADLVPLYLERRESDVVSLDEALRTNDYATVHILGHSMKGSGGGYGFDGITEIGLRIESAGKNEDTDAARTAIEDLKSYLSHLEVVYD